MAVRNIQVIFKQIPNGLPNPETDFEVVTGTIDPNAIELHPGQFLLRALFFSLDPYIRMRLQDPSNECIFPMQQIGKPLDSGVVGQILKSNDPKYAMGDVVFGVSEWAEYSITTASTFFGDFQKIPNPESSPFPLSYYLGILGMPGWTAYVGLHKICEPMLPGQTLFVSSAFGAVGQVVGQYGKCMGLRVVGAAGSDEKVNYLLNELGFDAAFNYKKHADLEAILRATCPRGIDINFENVGGKMLDAVLKNCNDSARVALCGMLGLYNQPNAPVPIYNLIIAIGKRIRLEGIAIFQDFETHGQGCIETFMNLLTEGKMKYKEDVTIGIENLPTAFVKMLTGDNFGKAVVEVATL